MATADTRSNRTPLSLLQTHDVSLSMLLSAFASLTRLRNLLQLRQKQELRELKMDNTDVDTKYIERLATLESVSHKLSSLFQEVLTLLEFLKLVSLQPNHVAALRRHQFRVDASRLSKVLFNNRTFFLSPKLYDILISFGCEVKEYLINVQKGRETMNQVRLERAEAFLSEFAEFYMRPKEAAIKKIGKKPIRLPRAYHDHRPSGLMACCLSRQGRRRGPPIESRMVQAFKGAGLLDVKTSLDLGDTTFLDARASWSNKLREMLTSTPIEQDLEPETKPRPTIRPTGRQPEKPQKNQESNHSRAISGPGNRSTKSISEISGKQKFPMSAMRSEIRKSTDHVIEQLKETSKAFPKTRSVSRAVSKKISQANVKKTGGGPRQAPGLRGSMSYKSARVGNEQAETGDQRAGKAPSRKNVSAIPHHETSGDTSIPERSGSKQTSSGHVLSNANSLLEPHLKENEAVAPDMEVSIPEKSPPPPPNLSRSESRRNSPVVGEASPLPVSPPPSLLHSPGKETASNVNPSTQPQEAVDTHLERGEAVGPEMKVGESPSMPTPKAALKVFPKADVSAKGKAGPKFKQLTKSSKASHVIAKAQTEERPATTTSPTLFEVEFADPAKCLVLEKSRSPVNLAGKDGEETFDEGAQNPEIAAAKKSGEGLTPNTMGEVGAEDFQSKASRNSSTDMASAQVGAERRGSVDVSRMASIEEKAPFHAPPEFVDATADHEAADKTVGLLRKRERKYTQGRRRTMGDEFGQGLSIFWPL